MVQFFASLHHNILKPKITEKCYGFLKLKFNVGGKNYQFGKFNRIFKMQHKDQFVRLNIEKNDNL